MNIFKKALIVALSVGLISVPTVTKEVEAADGTWSLAGTMNGWSASDTTYDLTYNSSNNRHEILYEFSSGVEFKFVKNHGWGTNIGTGGYNGGNISISAGNYLIWIADNIDEYDDKDYGWGADPIALDEEVFTTLKTVYFSASHWETGSAWFSAKFSNRAGDLSWVKAEETTADSVYSFSVPSGNWSKVTFYRNDPAKTALKESSAWNYSADIKFEENKNLLTIPNNGWTNSTGTWTEYSLPTVNYAITYLFGEEVLGTESVNENTKLKINKFFEKEGYRFEGWYLDSALTTRATGEEIVTKDISIYAKYIEAKDYRVYFNTTSLLGGESIYVYSFFNVDGSYNSSWPGLKASKDENSGLWYYDIDASKSWDNIIFNGGKDKEQTANLELTYQNTIYTIGEKDGEGHYTATTMLFDTVTAQLGVNYTYDSETNKLKEVTSASLRFATEEITKPTYTVTSYGMTIAFGGAAKDVVWTSEEIVEKEGKISWSGVVTNIPTSYFNVKVTVECFVMIGETKVVVSNSREVTIASLANEYIERADEFGLEPVQKAACQYIIDSVAA